MYIEHSRLQCVYIVFLMRSMMSSIITIRCHKMAAAKHLVDFSNAKLSPHLLRITWDQDVPWALSWPLFLGWSCREPADEEWPDGRWARRPSEAWRRYLQRCACQERRQIIVGRRVEIQSPFWVSQLKTKLRCSAHSVLLIDNVVSGFATGTSN